MFNDPFPILDRTGTIEADNKIQRFPAFTIGGGIEEIGGGRTILNIR
jgi:hypothetical protein